MITYEKFIERLVEVVGAEHVHIKPDGSCTSRCPAHNDKTPSLNVKRGEKQPVVLRCHAGCSFGRVMNALNFAGDDNSPQTTITPIPPRPTLSRAKSRKKRSPLGPIVETYDYRDLNDELVYQVTRHDPKDFRQRRPDGKGGWIWNLDGIQLILYKRHELIATPPESFVFVPEGEKDVERMISLGMIATTAPQGGGKWGKVDDTPLHGRHVVVLPDNDKTGLQHAHGIAKALQGKAASVRVLKLKDLPAKGDVSDWMDANDNDVKELMRLAKACEPVSDDDVKEMVKSAEASERTNEGDESARPVTRPKLVNLADVEATVVQWLWPGRIARGKVSMIAGHPGLGKSFITIDMAARVSTGRGWPDAPNFTSEPGGVVMLNCEDALDDTIRPRLDAAGADVSRINAIESVLRYNPHVEEETEYGFSLETDIAALEDAIKQTPNCRLVIIDPISAYLGGTDSHKNADVRGLLAPLSDLAKRYGVAIVLVNHLNKNSQGDAVNRVSGSGAFVAAARSVLGVGKDANDESRRLIVPIKNNIGNDKTGLAYTITEGDKGPYVAWEPDPIPMTADDMMSQSGNSKGNTDALDEACDWLKAELIDGPKPAGEIKAKAKADGISEATLRRAKKALNIAAKKGGFGKGAPWVWVLPLYDEQYVRTHIVNAYGDMSAFVNNEPESTVGGDGAELFDDVEDEPIPPKTGMLP